MITVLISLAKVGGGMRLMILKYDFVRNIFLLSGCAPHREIQQLLVYIVAATNTLTIIATTNTAVAATAATSHKHHVSFASSFMLLFVKLDRSGD